MRRGKRDKKGKARVKIKERSTGRWGMKGREFRRITGENEQLRDDRKEGEKERYPKG